MLSKRYILFVIVVFSFFILSAETRSSASFGAIPDDGVNDIEAFRRISEFCKANPGTVIDIVPGVYDISDTLARKIEREAISGVYGERVQERLFRPDGPYVTAFDLSSCRNIMINAEGAVFRLHGWYEVVSIVEAENVDIRGLSIVYNRPPNTVGRIVKSDADAFEMVFDRDRYCYIDSVVTGRVHFYDSKLRRLYTGGVSSKRLVNHSTILIASDRHPSVGDYCILRHGGHYRPAILIKESNDIKLNGISIHSQPGMGIVGHRSSNIIIDRLRVVPLEGDVISTNTDATHFTSCSGEVTIRNSEFCGQGDDCTNVHNYYYKIYPIGDNAAEIRVENADLHALSLDYPEIGDSMIIIDRRDMAEKGRYEVRDVDISKEKWQVVVHLDKTLPDCDMSYLVMTNFTRYPKVTIADNKVRSHLARAFLIKSPGAIIARNNIVGSCESAIKLGAELGWNESGPVNDILIEDNYIASCGYCGNRSNPTCILLATDVKSCNDKVNNNIIIRNNYFASDRPDVILIKDARNVKIYNNHVNQTDYVAVVNSDSVEVDGTIECVEDK